MAGPQTISPILDLDLSTLDLDDVVTEIAITENDLAALSLTRGVTFAANGAEMRSCSGWSNASVRDGS
jgi:hypothetical protein